MEQIRHINRCNTLQDRAVLTEDGSFCVPCLMETGIMKTRSERKGRHIQPLTDRRTTGQSWQTPLFGRQGRALRVSGKNHPRPEGLRYFSRQPCMYGTRPFMACSYGNSGPESRTDKNQMLCYRRHLFISHDCNILFLVRNDICPPHPRRNSHLTR